MKINSFCLACLINMQESQVRKFDDEEKKMDYMREILAFLSSCDPDLSAPALVKPLSRIYEKYWGKRDSMEEVKQEFNDYLLSMEEELEAQIRNHPDPLEAALCYARTGNYIDYAAVKDITKEKLLELFESQGSAGLEKEMYRRFLDDLEHASSLVWLTDNCGEIVLDKIAMKILREQYTDVKVTAIVRGEPVVNDADLEAARYVGLDRIVNVTGNGSGIAGTDLADISEEAEQLIRNADLIVSKGQGNFETIHGCGLNIYYLFLCKCEWFVQKFRAERFQGMFINERSIT
ncbi:MAG TPA: DUF89 family protein [Candidatus Mediterraneibacter quadrami]|uniref:DUF89 family protein n=1 Tax=Candidatus Mediterraneibacter quadrami TaxID=2838684 RepID=A0A9D2RB09_9FIRM|nr:DUF89 family protein [Candidatus Mediterraneibacter quadrami]